MGRIDSWCSTLCSAMSMILKITCFESFVRLVQKLSKSCSITIAKERKSDDENRYCTVDTNCSCNLKLIFMFPLLSFDVAAIVWKKKNLPPNKTFFIAITSLKQFLKYNPRRLIGSRIIELAAYCNHTLLALLYINKHKTPRSTESFRYCDQFNVGPKWSY